MIKLHKIKFKASELIAIDKSKPYSDIKSDASRMIKGLDLTNHKAFLEEYDNLIKIEKG